MNIVEFTRDFAKKNKQTRSQLFGTSIPASPLFPHQVEPWKIFINSGCFREELLKKGKKPNNYNEMFLAHSRRAGKDFLIWNCAVYYCLSAPLRNCFYMFPQISSGVQSILEGSMSRDFPSPDPNKPGRRRVKYMDLIPDGMVAKIDKKNSIIEFVNGSKIYFLSSQRTEMKRGSHTGLVVSSEYCFSMRDSLDAIRPMVAEVGGMIIMISTPSEFVNHSVETWMRCRKNDPRLFPHLLDKAKTNPDVKFSYTQLISAPQLCDNYGRRLISDEFLEEEKLKMGDAYVQREYFCKFRGSQSGSVYGEDISTIRARGQLKDNIPFSESSDIVVGMDLGATESTAIVFAQINDYDIQFIDCYINNGKPIEHYIKYLKDWEEQYNVKIKTTYAPHDIGYKNVAASYKNPSTGDYELAVIADIAENMGRHLTYVPAPRSKNDAAQLVRSGLYKSQFADTAGACGRLVEDLEKLHYVKDGQTNEFTDKIVRGKSFCHLPDAVQTLMLGLEDDKPGFITSSYKPEPKRSKKDTIYDMDFSAVKRKTAEPIALI